MRKRQLATQLKGGCLQDDP